MPFKNVLVLYVGGTIGMQRNENGVLIPVHDVFFDKLKNDHEMNEPKLAQDRLRELKTNELVLPRKSGHNIVIYKFIEYLPLLDSSNMTCEHWTMIALDIQQYYDYYDGFVILHGTDTLAYTSSVLSFMLDGLQKPVIVTGSQIPLFESNSDAKNNVIASLLIAGCYKIPEVCVYFAFKLFRGNRVTKMITNAFNAFDSPNYHVLAETGININVFKHYVRKAHPGIPFNVNTCMNTNVSVLTFIPTITRDTLQSILNPPTAGLIIQSYGAGNIPSSRSDIMDVLRNALNRKIMVINITQCSKGRVEAHYETGKALEDVGVISGEDLTAEAAVAKMMFVLALPNLTFEERIEVMKTDLRGEMTTSSY